nr:MAG TPA: hypothetical protein [Caudoviricetes sp.]
MIASQWLMKKFNLVYLVINDESIVAERRCRNEPVSVSAE